MIKLINNLNLTYNEKSNDLLRLQTCASLVLTLISGLIIIIIIIPVICVHSDNCMNQTNEL